MSAKKQYVNLEKKDASESRHGQEKTVYLDMDTADSEGKSVYYFLEPDGGNLHLTKPAWFAAMERPCSFMFDPPARYRRTAVVKDKKAVVNLRLSIGGGDKFKISYGKKDDKSDAKDSGLGTYEVWKKVFARLGLMPNAGAIPNFGTVQAEYLKSFVEIEQEGGFTRVKHERFVSDAQAVCSGLPQGSHKDQSMYVVFVDRIAQPGWLKIADLVYTPRDVGASGKKTIDLPKKKLTWPTDETTWVRGKITVLYGDGRELERTDMSSFVTPVGGWPHDKGRAAKKIEIDLNKLGPGFNEWSKQGAGWITVSIEVQTIEKAAAGRTKGAQMIVGTRHPQSYKDASSLNATTSHEIMHVFGFVPKKLPVYDAGTGKLTNWKANDNHYSDAFGGRGNHCSTGATLNSELEFEGGRCIMFHQGHAGRGTGPCGDCQNILRRVRLNVLPAPRWK